MACACPVLVSSVSVVSHREQPTRLRQPAYGLVYLLYIVVRYLGYHESRKHVPSSVPGRKWAQAQAAGPAASSINFPTTCCFAHRHQPPSLLPPHTPSCLTPFIIIHPFTTNIRSQRLSAVLLVSLRTARPRDWCATDQPPQLVVTASFIHRPLLGLIH